MTYHGRNAARRARKELEKSRKLAAERAAAVEQARPRLLAEGERRYRSAADAIYERESLSFTDVTPRPRHDSIRVYSKTYRDDFLTRDRFVSEPAVVGVFRFVEMRLVLDSRRPHGFRWWVPIPNSPLGNGTVVGEVVRLQHQIGQLRELIRERQFKEYSHFRTFRSEEGELL